MFQGAFGQRFPSEIWYVVLARYNSRLVASSLQSEFHNIPKVTHNYIDYLFKASIAIGRSAREEAP